MKYNPHLNELRFSFRDEEPVKVQGRTLAGSITRRALFIELIIIEKRTGTRSHFSFIIFNNIVSPAILSVPGRGGKSAEDLRRELVVIAAGLT